MAKYRKQPVVIEAVQLLPENAEELKVFLKGVKKHPMWVHEDGSVLTEDLGNCKPALLIPTLEGDHLAKEGDWIIKGVAGEFYPCKNDIFFKTYVPE